MKIIVHRGTQQIGHSEQLDMLGGLGLPFNIRTLKDGEGYTL